MHGRISFPLLENFLSLSPSFFLCLRLLPLGCPVSNSLPASAALYCLPQKRYSLFGGLKLLRSQLSRHYSWSLSLLLFPPSSPNVMSEVAEDSRSRWTNTANKMASRGGRGHLIAEGIWAGRGRLGCSVLLGNSLRVVLRPLDSISWVYGQEGVHKATWVNGRRMEVCVFVCEREVGWCMCICLPWVWTEASFSRLILMVHFYHMPIFSILKRCV